ncbi:hypothetical protein AB0L63_32070 [Nocardia sp. NPDC051990]|uniref:hypothetical protein n=1 Tax=Nocardia sp. NPDC051990 TaxID=3155285 RepID=UPI0034411B8C
MYDEHSHIGEFRHQQTPDSERAADEEIAVQEAHQVLHGDRAGDIKRRVDISVQEAHRPVDRQVAIDDVNGVLRQTGIVSYRQRPVDGQVTLVNEEAFRLLPEEFFQVLRAVVGGFTYVVALYCLGQRYRFPTCAPLLERHLTPRVLTDTCCGPVSLAHHPRIGELPTAPDAVRPLRVESHRAVRLHDDMLELGSVDLWPDRDQGVRVVKR